MAPCDQYGLPAHDAQAIGGGCDQRKRKQFAKKSLTFARAGAEPIGFFADIAIKPCEFRACRFLCGTGQRFQRWRRALARRIPIRDAAVCVRIGFGKKRGMGGATRTAQIARDLIPGLDRKLPARAQHLQFRIAGSGNQAAIAGT